MRQTMATRWRRLTSRLVLQAPRALRHLTTSLRARVRQGSLRAPLSRAPRHPVLSTTCLLSPWHQIQRHPPEPSRRFQNRTHSAKGKSPPTLIPRPVSFQHGPFCHLSLYIPSSSSIGSQFPMPVAGYHSQKKGERKCHLVNVSSPSVRRLAPSQPIWPLFYFESTALHHGCSGTWVMS